MRLLALAFASALASSGCVSTAQPGETHAMRDGYSYLGERFVDSSNHHDAISVDRADGRITSIMIVVENAPVEIFDIVVTFGDGQRQDIPTRLVFGPDATTRQLSLAGGARIIRKVDFHHGNLRDQGRAKVELWGR